jgi:dTMP kinase
LRAFITLEGPDGSGKSTQAALLAERLQQLGFQVVLTREPGGTAVGHKLREILLDPDNQLTVMTEILLMAADRAQHVEEVIKPALENNMIVVCDRYVDSSLAYQGFGLLGDPRQVKAINEVAIGGVWPTLTVFLDVQPEVGLKRHLLYSSNRTKDSGLDRIEQRDLSFHQRVREGYYELQNIYQERFALVDTTLLGIETVAQKVWEIVVQRLKIETR